MKFTINREHLLGPLQLACSVVERRQTLPVLSSLLMVLDGNSLVVTGTDQEIEVTVRIPDVNTEETGKVTVPAFKLMDICKSLPEGADLDARQDATRIAVDSGPFRSHLSTLPVEDFPFIKPEEPLVGIRLEAAELGRLLRRTSFAMAQQDVRFFYNGVLVHIQGKEVRLVATNGLRLATSCAQIDESGQHQFIVPRKAVGEIVRILDGAGESEEIRLEFTANHLLLERGNITLISKLIDSTYPDYSVAIPQEGDRVLQVDRRLLEEALSRIAILSNETYRNVRLMLSPGKLDMHAKNPQQEEAEETLAVDYEGEPLEIGFNVLYLIEALNVVQGEQVQITFNGPEAACLLKDPEEPTSLFVISPMVL